MWWAPHPAPYKATDRRITPSGGTALDWIGEQVRLRPAAVAVRHNGRNLIYRDMWAKAGVLAADLIGRDLAPGSVVALSAARSAGLTVGFLGILMSGSACLPLDPAWPHSRLEFMLDDADVPAVVGDAPALASLHLAGRAAVELGGAGPIPSGPCAPPYRARPDDLCYLIYTSGSTGQPKGVMQEHRHVASITRWQCADSLAGPGDVTAQFAPISFDVSVQEIFPTLAVGGTLVCLNEADRADPSRLWDVLREERIARLYLPFAALETLALFSGAASPPAHLREVITAGEQLKCSDPIREMFSWLPHCRLTNHYGPTETHVVTRHHLGGDPASWPMLPPIGSPVRGARLAVLDEAGRPVPDGEQGQLWVGGPPVARGYWRRPELTAERFAVRDGARWYLTGDLVRVAGTELEFLGRIDDQVKVRGIRIEPAEVEIALMTHPAVRAAAVVAVGPSASSKVLVAFVEAANEAPLAGLREYLGARLPDSMVPTRFERLSRIPRTPSGKADRRALQASIGGAGNLKRSTNLET
jgi:amino acid adenylation domain-containing protein